MSNDNQAIFFDTNPHEAAFSIYSLGHTSRWKCFTMNWSEIFKVSFLKQTLLIFAKNWWKGKKLMTVQLAPKISKIDQTVIGLYKTATSSREVLLKGKIQYNWPPYTN